MPINPLFLADLNPSQFYHICNRTNNKELLFRTDENRRFFMKKFDNFLSYLLDVYTWSLLPNHFHFLVKMKTDLEARDWLLNKKEGKYTKTELAFLNEKIQFSDLSLQAFTRFFQSYSTSFNNVFGRKGNLFYSSFKRVLVEDDLHFQRSVVYIHTNPVKHGIISDFRDYKWSSWHEYMNKRPSKIKREETYEIFGGNQAFLTAHKLHQSFLQDNIYFKQGSESKTLKSLRL